MDQRRNALEPILNARRDTPDFRDRLYEATLVEVPPVLSLEEYQAHGVPILDQGREGACTGFGLATVANYLLRKLARRQGNGSPPEPPRVSPRMFYEMARRYDEWAGENYEGSSCRGALKGWHKHGICTEERWAYDSASEQSGVLTEERAAEAMQHPLGAYYRVNHKDLVCMHSALAEVGILYASSKVHSGWMEVGGDGHIQLNSCIEGGHAFAIIGYDAEGFWIQNSWGHEYGKQGFCHLTYDDWLANGSDVWAVRLGAPISRKEAGRVTQKTRAPVAGSHESYAFADLRPHIISLGNDGHLRPGGTYGTSRDDVRQIFEQDFPRITRDWPRKRLMLYAHGGLVDESSAVQRVARHREKLLREHIYPLEFIWKSDFLTTMLNILREALRRRSPELMSRGLRELMEDRIDDMLEPLARRLGGKAQWEEMKENAMRATSSARGGARFAAAQLAELSRKDPSLEFHLVGHSAGAVFHAPLVQLLASRGRIGHGPMAGETGHGLPITSCTLWAPACTTGLFKETYLPLAESGGLGQLTLFTLTRDAECDDTCAGIYRKSLLYLVSNAFEPTPRIPLIADARGQPLLGMATFIQADAALSALFRDKAQWVLSPNDVALGQPGASRARSHGGFDDDEATLHSTLAYMNQASAAASTRSAPPLSAPLPV